MSAYDRDYSTLLDLFIQLVQSRAGSKIPPGDGWLNDAQVLAVKLFRHLVSMQTLAARATVEHEGVPAIFFVDHASVKVVARAALETYLVFFYLYGSPDLSLCEFRHKTWRLGGLADRQKYFVFIPEHREVLARELKVMEELRSQIEASPHVAGYSDKQRNKLLEGECHQFNMGIDTRSKSLLPCLRYPFDTAHAGSIMDLLYPPKKHL